MGGGYQRHVRAQAIDSDVVTEGRAKSVGGENPPKRAHIPSKGDLRRRQNATHDQPGISHERLPASRREFVTCIWHDQRPADSGEHPGVPCAARWHVDRLSPVSLEMASQESP